MTAIHLACRGQVAVTTVPARPGRVPEPPSEELYEMLARRRDGR